MGQNAQGQHDRSLLAWALLIALLMSLCFVSAMVGQGRLYSEIQQALDRACGPRAVDANEGDMNWDPIGSWSSPKAECYRNVATTAWMCTCRTQ
jgi:hypothetical protein